MSRTTEDAASVLALATSLSRLREAAQDCTRCPLYRHATQTVFGEGPRQARIVLIGEQPGNQEDLQGHPFVGPSGKLLNQCLQDAGLERKELYVTNTVKHIKWVAIGKRRINKKASAGEIAACRPWLEAELHLIQPRLIVALGATAAQNLMGASFRVTRSRGEFFPFREGHLMATVHPSSLLRTPSAEKEAQIALFVRDLRKAASWLKKHKLNG